MSLAATGHLQHSEHPDASAFDEDFGDIVAEAHRDDLSPGLASDNDVASTSKYELLPPAFHVKPLGEYEAERAEETKRQVKKAALLQKAMAARGYDSSKLLDHLALNLGPVLAVLLAMCADVFYEDTTIVLTEKLLQEWLAIYGLLCVYGTSSTEYFNDSNRSQRRYIHGLHITMDEKQFRSILKCMSKRTERRAFRPDPKIEKLEIALVEGFKLNLQHAVFTNLACDDLHEQQRSGEANQEGFVITNNPQKARPFGTTTDIATTSGGVLIAMRTHVHHSTKAAEFIAGALTTNLSAAGHVCRKLILNLDRGFSSLASLALSAGFQLRQTTQRGSNRYSAAWSIPEAKLSLANRDKFGTFIMHPTAEPCQAWVKETMPVGSTRPTVYHLASTNGAGKTLLMSTTLLEHVNVNIVLLEHTELRKTVTSTVELPLPPFEFPLPGVVFPYPEVMYLQSMNGRFRELCIQSSPLWWEMRKGGTTSTIASNVVKMHGQAKRWLANIGDVARPQLCGILVNIVLDNGNTTRVMNESTMRVTQTDFSSFQSCLSMLLEISRHQHVVDTALANVEGTLLNTADTRLVNNALKVLKLLPANKTLEARRAMVAAGRLEHVNKILTGDPAVLVANKSFTATEPVKEGLLDEPTIRAQFPAFYLKNIQDADAAALAGGDSTRRLTLNVSKVREMPIVENCRYPHVRDSPDGVYARILKRGDEMPVLEHVALECKNLTGDASVKECRLALTEFGRVHELFVMFDPHVPGETVVQAKVREKQWAELGKLLGKLCGSPGYAIQ